MIQIVKYLLLLMVLSVNCSDYDHKISNLEHKKIELEDLPQAVKDFYMDPSGYKNGGKGVCKTDRHYVDLVCLSEYCDYYTEHVLTCFGPFTAYVELIDFGRGMSYRIEQGIPSPFVVHEDKLYIVNQYNILRGLIDHATLEITCYTLRDAR